jgi:two-component sensor histidine kinase
VFKDNGVGIPADFDFENPSTLGLTLIQTLAKQLDGNCSFEREEEGTTFKLQFEVAKLRQS